MSLNMASQFYNSFDCLYKVKSYKIKDANGMQHVTYIKKTPVSLKVPVNYNITHPSQ